DVSDEVASPSALPSAPDEADVFVEFASPELEELPDEIVFSSEEPDGLPPEFPVVDPSLPFSELPLDSAVSGFPSWLDLSPAFAP
ncbi:hypothetical protein, partial [Neisseria gonorrhoeae]|uniref:hypothetical protein n=1 Tax=Neisseria gonorrhoeae TaxID=485 RepID=UPI00384BF28C